VLAASLAGPLANGQAVGASAWRDVHEGAIADLLTFPGICRVDVRPRGDSLSIRHVNLSAGELRSLPAGRVAEVGLCAEDWDGPRVQLSGQHTAFRIVASDRTVDVSILIGVCRLLDEGIVRISAQAILRDADA
jgi:hypothetical protein